MDGISPKMEEIVHGVSKQDLEMLKKMAPTVISEALLQKILDINQVGRLVFFKISDITWQLFG